MGSKEPGFFGNDATHPMIPIFKNRTKAYGPRGTPVLDDFEQLSVLGEGAMGKVYKARQISFDRLVALKVLRPHIGKIKKLVDRLDREAYAMFRLEHPQYCQSL